MAGLPWKRLEAVSRALSQIAGTREIAVEFVCRDTGRRTRVSATWDAVEHRYVSNSSAPPHRVFFLYNRQYDYFQKIIAAYKSNQRGEAPAVQDVIVTAGRRAGKSSLAAAICLYVSILHPGTIVRIVGKRKAHGRRIIERVRHHLPRWAWEFEPVSVSLALFNFSRLETSASDLAKEYDIGTHCHLLVYDEAAVMHPDTYTYMSPSVVDFNGINLITTTHRGFSWVYDKIRQARAGVRSVVHLEMSALENTFLSVAARERLEALREVLSEAAYASEVLGQAVPEHGLAFPSFSRDNVFSSAPELDSKYTAALAAYAWGSQYAGVRFLVGCDFNSNFPNYAVLIQLDDVGGAWVVGELEAKGTTDEFGVALAEYLAARGVGIQEVVLVADGSGDWQSPTGKKFANRNPSWDVLRAQGWTVRAPSADGRRANPLRWQRLEVVRTLLRSGAGAINLHVHTSCQHVIDMLQSLPMDGRRQIHDVTSRHAHIYDAMSYPLFRIWGTSLGVKVFGRRLVAPLAAEQKEEDEDVVK